MAQYSKFSLNLLFMHTDSSTRLTLLPHHGVVFGFDGHGEPLLIGGWQGEVGLSVQLIGALQADPKL